MEATAGTSGREALVTGREMAPVLLWALVIAALTAWPYVWAVQSAGPDQQFQGFLWGVDDGNVYLSWIRQASEGRVLLRNQYTTVEQNPHFFNVFLLALGRVTAWTGQHPGIIFHASRLLGNVALLLMIYLLAAFVTRSVAARWGALALASLGSGFGWLAAIWASSVPPPLPPPLRPPDYAPLPPQTWQVMPEAVTFLSMLLNPLFVWSMALMCGVLVSAAIALERRSIAWAVPAGLLLLLVGNMHTYDLPVLHTTTLLFALILVLQRRIKFADALLIYAIIFIIALPAPVWGWWAANQDPSYLAKVETPTLSPPVHDYIVGYGLILLLAIPGAWYAIKRRRENPRLLLPVCWVGINALLLYAPVAFQRKMAEGLHIPLCLLAGIALALVIAPALAVHRVRPESVPGVVPAGARPKWRSRPPTQLEYALLVVLAVAVTLPSNLLFVNTCLHHVATNNRELLRYLQPPIYLSFDEVNGIEALAAKAGPDEIVLSSSLTGNHIPARASCLVFSGHWAETLEFGRTVDYVGQLLLPGRERHVLWSAVRRINASYVFYGPLEALLAEQMMLAADLEPPEDPAAEFRRSTEQFLRPVFERGEVTVYRFDPNAQVELDFPRHEGPIPTSVADAL